MCIAAAIVGGSVVSAGVQASAQRKAGKQAAAATRESNAIQQEQFYQTREDNAPIMEMRNALLPRLQSQASQDVSVSANDVANDPGYQFGLNERQRLGRNSFAAGNGLYRGSTAKALGRDAQDYGMTRYNDVFNRKQTEIGNAFNRTSSAAGFGQAGVNQTQQAGQTYANNVGNNLLNNANFQGAAGMAQANTWGGALNNASSYIGGSSLPGFNGNALTGYTNQQPWAVGPQR